MSSSRTKIGYRTRQWVKLRDHFECQHCGAFTDLTVDHIKPLGLGGSNGVDNMQTLCASCNVAKDRYYESDEVSFRRAVAVPKRAVPIFVRGRLVGYR